MNLTSPCDHQHFTAYAEVAKYVGPPDTGAPGYHVALRVKCKLCLAPLQFHMPRYGQLWDDAALSADALEVRLPADLTVTLRDGRGPVL